MEHSANFFLQVSSFTRHLLDDILPVEVYNKPNISPDIVESLSKECDDLIESLQNFKLRTNATQVDENAEIKDNVHFNFNKLCESIIENTVTISDIMKYKLFYCKICNLTTWQENVINEHCTSIKHVEQTNQKVEPLTVFKCKHCYLVLIAPQSEINSIKLLSNHRKLDEHIRKLKETNVKEQGKSETNIEQYLTRSNADLINLGKTVGNAPKLITAEVNVTPISIKNKINSEQRSTGTNVVQNDAVGNVTKSGMPQKVKQALKLMKKKLRVDRRFPDAVLHYCNICDVVVNSITSYIQHNSSKQHISAVNNATNPINLYKCERCKVLITGYPAVIDLIISSDLHKEIDEWVKTLKTVPVQKQDTSIIKTAQTGMESTVKSSSSTFQQSSEQMSIPYDLKDSLILIYEKVTKANDLKKYAPSYCFLCERNIDSFNNFQQHLKAKQHNLLCSTITQAHCFHQCTVCLLALFGTENEISNTIKSKEHINLDEKINNLFKNNININSENSQIDAKVTKEKLSTPVENVLNVSTSPKIKSTSNVPKVSTSPKIKSSPSITTNKNAIPTKFFAFNAKLISGYFKKSGFCRLCNKGVLIKNGWAVHMNCKKHIAKSMETVANKNLIPARCKFCPFQILGDQQYDNVCWNVHMKLNHPEAKGTEIRNGVDLITELNQTSVISTQQYVNSNIKNDIDNLVPNKLQLTNDNAEIHDNCSSKPTILDETKIQDSLSSEKIANSSSESNNLNLDIFIKFLKKKKTIYLEEGLNKFGGICLICSMIFEDYYVWLIHTKGTTHRDVDQTNICERECEKCNLNLFGERSLIDHEFWPLEEHVALDTLIA